MTSYTLIWMQPAMVGFVQLRQVDPLLAKSVRAVVAGLADDPRPLDSTPLGKADLRRLRVGTARMIYQVDESAQAVQILTIGRTGARPS